MTLSLRGGIGKDDGIHREWSLMAILGESPEDALSRKMRHRNRQQGGVPLQEGTRREAPGDARLAATLRVNGNTVEQIASVLEFSWERTRKLLKRVDVQLMMGKFREQHRVQTVERVTAMTPRIFERMGDALDDGAPVADVKDLAKTVLDLERVAASASGELKPGGTTIQVANILNQQNGGDPKRQLAELLTALDEGAGG